MVKLWYQDRKHFPLILCAQVNVVNTVVHRPSANLPFCCVRLANRWRDTICQLRNPTRNIGKTQVLSSLN